MARGIVRRLELGGTALALSAVLAGCGGSDDSKKQPSTAVPNDQRAILATVDALQTASRHDDAQKICREIFAKSLADSIRHASKHSCETEVHESLASPDAQLSVARKIDIKGPRATTIIREQNGNTSTISFVKEGGSWRIERVTPVKSG